MGGLSTNESRREHNQLRSKKITGLHEQEKTGASGSLVAPGSSLARAWQKGRLWECALGCSAMMPVALRTPHRH